jgi:hypothetical protein
MRYLCRYRSQQANGATDYGADYSAPAYSPD